MKRTTFLTALFPLLFGLFGIATARADETTDKVRPGLGLGFATLSTSSTSAIPTTAVSTPVSESPARFATPVSSRTIRKLKLRR